MENVIKIRNMLSEKEVGQCKEKVSQYRHAMESSKRICFWGIGATCIAFGVCAYLGLFFNESFLWVGCICMLSAFLLFFREMANKFACLAQIKTGMTQKDFYRNYNYIRAVESLNKLKNFYEKYKDVDCHVEHDKCADLCMVCSERKFCDAKCISFVAEGEADNGDVHRISVHIPFLFLVKNEFVSTYVYDFNTGLLIVPCLENKE